jgi:hypothetical protein
MSLAIYIFMLLSITPVLVHLLIWYRAVHDCNEICCELNYYD